MEKNDPMNMFRSAKKYKGIFTPEEREDLIYALIVDKNEVQNTGEDILPF